MTDATLGAKIPSPLGGRAAHRRIGELARKTNDPEDLYSLLRLASVGRGVARKHETEREDRLYGSLVRSISRKLERVQSLTGSKDR